MSTRSGAGTRLLLRPPSRSRRPVGFSRMYSSCREPDRGGPEHSLGSVGCCWPPRCCRHRPRDGIVSTSDASIGKQNVPEYWIVDLDARAFERSTPGEEKPEVIRDRLTWHPEATAGPLVI